MSTTPEWAQDRAADVFDNERKERPDAAPETIWREALARHIAQHETPPPDPDHAALRRIAMLLLGSSGAMIPASQFKMALEQYKKEKGA